MKNVFTVAFIIARNCGFFADFSDIIGRGHIGMQYTVQLDGRDCWIKNAGHVVQSRWLDFHCGEQQHIFTNARAKAAFSEWIELPALVHGPELGRTLATWNEQALAAHNESLTFVLSSRLMHAYLELQVCFRRLYFDRGEESTTCTRREPTGEPCQKKRHQASRNN